MYQIRPSDIHGNGLFATINIPVGKKIDVAIYINQWFIPIITDHCGKWINHSSTPNTHLKRDENRLNIYATQSIQAGEELTIDYRKTPWFIQKPSAIWK